MKKNYIKLLFVSFFLFLVFPLGVNASNGYTIENYEVDIKVNENNVLNIKEVIDVNFEYEKHGIIRVIPYKNTYYRTGKTAETRALIKNLNVNANYTTSKENGELKVKIGDASTTLTGNKQYVITYDYDVGDDNVDDYDDFYFNVIGTNWDTEIKNVRFKIEMPKEFDTTKVNFTVGKYGSTYYEDVKYTINGTTINGYVMPYSNNTYALSSYEGLTARIELPEGYFKGERVVFDPTLLILVISITVSVFLIVLSIILYTKLSLRKKDLLVPEYSVPDNLTPSEIGYLYKGSTDNKHIVSLITYFANKGYLQIIENSKRSFSFQKLKEIDDSEPEYAKTTFNGLFKKANSEGIVKKSSLEDTFYTTLSSALAKLSHTHKIYSTSHYVLYFVYFGLIFIPWLLSSFLNQFVTYRLTTDYAILNIISKILIVASVIIGIIFVITNKKRTEEATKYYNRINGFKDYLMCVEKDKLEMLVNDNPNYFFDILPYAYVLGVSDIWSKKFESIAIAPPTWYVGTMYSPATGAFDVNRFNNSLTSTLSSVNTTMSSRPCESSGSSGGGSFSGGGGGGGGGSSW